ncbi:hypothetical protein ABKN59_010897 [Abortiporus biennis]
MALLDSDSNYARCRRRNIELVNQLRGHGAQDVLDLPRIAVIGNQSAGKSSLVEAISGVTVPRDVSTCTRCPMECRLSHSQDEWSCQISIREEFDGFGHPRDQVQERRFGHRINDKKYVELMIQRAQASVLNPFLSRDTVAAMSLKELQQIRNTLQFSQNIVCVDISGPELPDLAFIDLPGLIQNADQSVVRLVEDLVKSHIKGNCLILVTLPMSDDIENQKAMRLAKDADPTGERTIGVMTKPDMLTAGGMKSRQIWLNILEGRTHPLKHGYYCTRQPDDDERSRGIGPDEARINEMDFFATNEPWSLSLTRNRFGTKNLSESLSDHLSNIIDQSIPILLSAASKRRSIYEAELRSLHPVMTTDPTSHVFRLVSTLSNEMKLRVEGSPASPQVVQASKEAYRVFKRAIYSTTPTFIPFKNANEQSQYPDSISGVSKFIADSSDEDFLGSEDQSSNTQQPMFLFDVRDFVQKSRLRELPNNVPYNAKVSLIKQFQRSWEDSTHECAETIRNMFQETLSKVIAEGFGQYKSLETRVMAIIEDLLQEKYQDALVLIGKLLKFEKVPFTQNNYYLSDTKNKWLAKYKDARALVGRQSGTSMASTRSATVTSAATSPASSTSLASSTSIPTVNGYHQQGAFFSFSQLPSSGPSAHSIPTSATSGPSVAPTLQPSNSNPAAITTPHPHSGGFMSISGPGFAVSPPPVNQATKDQREALAALAKLGYNGLTIEDLGKLLPADEFEEESMLQGAPNARETCAVWLEEDPSITVTRNELNAKKKMLEDVLARLRNFGLSED